MSWKEIKKSLNSTIGTKKSSTLDEIASVLASDIYYNTMITKYAVEENGGNVHVGVVKYGAEEIEDERYKEDEVIRTAIIPSTVKRIGEGAFYSCSNIYSIVIPDSVKEIASSAFEDCYNLQNVVISKNLEYIESAAFYNTGIECIHLPATVKRIRSNAFDQCNYLTDIYVEWSEGEISGAPWGATNATVHYKENM